MSEDVGDPLLVLAPLRAEAIALRAGLPRTASVVRTGMGRERALEAARRARSRYAAAVVVAGVCGAVDRGLAPGDVVVATELRDSEGAVRQCAGAALLAHSLERRGLRVRTGPLLSLPSVTGPEERRALEGSALAVDMESAWLVGAGDDRPFAVARVVVDTADRRLLDLRTIVAGARALGALRRLAPGLADWASAVAPRTILLAGPRSDDIRYATQSRQQALTAVARASDLVLVVGSTGSSDSIGLLEVAEREGARAHLVEDERDIDPAWLVGARRIGVTAGASASEHLVGRVVGEIAGLGPVEVEERTMTTEEIQFDLPREVLS